MNMATVQWLAKSGLTAALLLVVCGIFTGHLGAGLQAPLATTRDGTLVTLNRYVNEPVPDVVLVGSSLTFRLKEEYFASTKLRNLAIAGGSPVTGLEIVANQARLPRIVLVETNVLSRPIDEALVRKYSGPAKAEPMFIRPIRMAVAYYENWNHAPATHAQMAAAHAQLLAQPPSNFDNHVYVERAVQEGNAEDPTASTQINVQRIEQLITALEKRGARVLLFELPLSSDVEATRYATITRDIAHAKFPDSTRWLKIDVPRSELRWADGNHLDERSAIMVGQSIDRMLRSML
jgi:hypothetical protein